MNDHKLTEMVNNAIVKAKWSDDPQQYEVTPCTNLDQALAQAKGLAKELNHPIKFPFNATTKIKKQYQVDSKGEISKVKF